MNPHIVRRTILAELMGAAPNMLPQPQLFLAVNARVRPQLTLADLVEALSWLRDRDMVGFEPDPFDPDNRDARLWFVKEAGRAAAKS